jgi:cell division GTPase FtsZ
MIDSGIQGIDFWVANTDAQVNYQKFSSCVADAQMSFCMHEGTGGLAC